MADHLQSNCPWPSRLPDHYGWNTGSKPSLEEGYSNNTINRFHDLVHGLLPTNIRTIDEIHSYPES